MSVNDSAHCQGYEVVEVEAAVLRLLLALLLSNLVDFLLLGLHLPTATLNTYLYYFHRTRI